MNADVLDLEIASPIAAAQHASTELAAPIERTTALFAPFAAPFAKAAELLLQESSATDADSARALRLKIVKARTEIARTKDAAKADVKLVGQVIDWYNRKGAEQCEQAEARLLEIEKAQESAEAARKKALTEERAAALEKYGVDSTFFQLADMPDALFAKLLDTSRAGFEAKAAAEAKLVEDARLAAEKMEADRIAREKADAEERERVRIENDRLKREADERAEADRIERERTAAEQKAERERASAELARRAAVHAARVDLLRPYLLVIETSAIPELQYADATTEQFSAILAQRKAQHEERERLAREKVEAEARAKAEREAADKAARIERERVAAEKAELERKASEERKAREKLEAEDRARRDADAKRQQDEVDAAARAAAAPDRDKLVAFGQLVGTLELPAMATTAGKHAAANIRDLIDDLVIQIELAATKLGGRRAQVAELPGMSAGKGAAA